MIESIVEYMIATLEQTKADYVEMEEILERKGIRYKMSIRFEQLEEVESNEKN